MAEYENSLKHYRDLKGVVDTSFEEGVETERKRIATQMKQKGTAAELIKEFTGLSIEEINSL